MQAKLYCPFPEGETGVGVGWIIQKYDKSLRENRVFAIGSLLVRQYSFLIRHFIRVNIQSCP